MKVVIFSGGKGSRLSPDFSATPKPLAPIGGMPILWHVMKLYASQGYNDFLLLLGHRSEEYALIEKIKDPSWSVQSLFTGIETQTAGRLFLAKNFLPERFFLTYADGLANINLQKLLAHHQEHRPLLTMSAVHPTLPYGLIEREPNGLVSTFKEKDVAKNLWINGGFMVCEPQLLDHLTGDGQESFEAHTLKRLAEQRKLTSFPHEGFWGCLDNARDLEWLQSLWQSGDAPWLTHS